MKRQYGVVAVEVNQMLRQEQNYGRQKEVFKQWIAAKLFDVGAWLMDVAAEMLDDFELFDWEDGEDCE